MVCKDAVGADCELLVWVAAKVSMAEREGWILLAGVDELYSFAASFDEVPLLLRFERVSRELSERSG